MKLINHLSTSSSKYGGWCKSHCPGESNLLPLSPCPDAATSCNRPTNCRSFNAPDTTQSYATWYVTGVTSLARTPYPLLQQRRFFSISRCPFPSFFIVYWHITADISWPGPSIRMSLYWRQLWAGSAWFSHRCGTNSLLLAFQLLEESHATALESNSSSSSESQVSVLRPGRQCRWRVFDLPRFHWVFPVRMSVVLIRFPMIESDWTPCLVAARCLRYKMSLAGSEIRYHEVALMTIDLMRRVRRKLMGNWVN